MKPSPTASACLRDTGLTIEVASAGTIVGVNTLRWH